MAKNCTLCGGILYSLTGGKLYTLVYHSQKDMNVKLENGKVVNAPILADCPVNIECTIVDSIITGSHEMFIGKVEYVHADSDLIGPDGDIDFSKISFI